MLLVNSAIHCSDKSTYMKSKVTPFLTLKLNLPKITMGVDFFHKNFEGGSTGDGIQKS